MADQPEPAPDAPVADAPAPKSEGAIVPPAQQMIVANLVPTGPILPTPGIDETVEGGAYIVDGRWVNANGDEIKAPKGRK